MSFIQKIFGQNRQEPQQAPQVQMSNNPAKNPAPANPQQTAQTDANGVVPQQSTEPASPTAKFAEVWQPPKQDTTQTSQEDQLTPDKILEAAGKVDFTKVLDPATLSKVSAGGEEAVQAFAQALNKVAQTSYGQSIVVAQKMIEKELGKARETFSKEVPTIVRRQAARDSLLRDNPAFKDPAVAPVVAAIQNALEQKHPNATPQELAELSKEWMTAAAGVFNPQKPKTPEQDAANADTNWEDYFKS